MVQVHGGEQIKAGATCCLGSSSPAPSPALSLSLSLSLLLQLFTSIYGCGYATADKWYNMGLRTIDDVRHHSDLSLTETQQLGEYLQSWEVTTS